MGAPVQVRRGSLQALVLWLQARGHERRNWGVLIRARLLHPGACNGAVGGPHTSGRVLAEALTLLFCV